MAAEILAVTLTGFAITLGLAPAHGSSPDEALRTALFVGTSMHVASSGCLFGFGEVRRHALDKPRRYIVVPAVLVVTAASVAAVTSAHRLDVVLLGFFGWQFFHYQKQNLGLAALAARSKNVAGLSPVERKAMLATGLGGIAALLASPKLLQLPISTPGSAGLRAAAVIAFVGTALIGAAAMFRRRRSQRPRGFAAVYLAALCFPLPIFVFHSPYRAVAGMTVAHGLQYLLLVGHVTAGQSRQARALRVAAYAAVAVASGAVLAVLSHLDTGGLLLHAAYGGYLGLVMSHFVVDAGLWRLRDEFPRRFLSARLPALAGLSPAGGLP